MNIKVLIKTKQKPNLFKFTKFFKHLIKKKVLSFTGLNFKQVKSIFSILKSPHVYKTSQEQVGFVYCLRQLTFFILNKSLIFFFFKKTNNFLFNNVSLTLSVIYNTLFYYKNALKRFHCKFYIMFFNFSKTYLKIFDLFGESFLNSKIV